MALQCPQITEVTAQPPASQSMDTTLWSHLLPGLISCLAPPHSPHSSRASLFSHIKLVPTSGPLHMLFSLPETHCPLFCTWLAPPHSIFSSSSPPRETIRDDSNALSPPAHLHCLSPFTLFYFSEQLSLSEFTLFIPCLLCIDCLTPLNPPYTPRGEVYKSRASLSFFHPSTWHRHSAYVGIC